MDINLSEYQRSRSQRIEDRQLVSHIDGGKLSPVYCQFYGMNEGGMIQQDISIELVFFRQPEAFK